MASDPSEARMARSLLIIILGLCISRASCQNMTLMSGQVVNLGELYKATNWKCCIPQSFLGDYTPIVQMEGSTGQYYVTMDPECKDAKDIIPSASYPATYNAIWACGKCEGGKCPEVDGGLSLALPGDWCVTSDNKPDPMVLCSTAAPVCDAGYSGKCVAVPDDATKAVSDKPSITLQSGMVINLVTLQNQYEGQCCLPRSVINDYSPIVRIDNSNGNFFVSNDPNCNTPIVSNVFPAMFEYIHVCDSCPPGGCYSQNNYVVNGGVTLLRVGVSTCDPYNYYGGGCWGAAPICSFARVCVGVPSYDFYWNSWDDGWGYYRPVWWLPLRRRWRPSWFRPNIFDRPFPPIIIRPRPPGWIPGNPFPPNWGWTPGQRPPGWRPRPPHSRPGAGGFRPDNPDWFRPIGGRTPPAGSGGRPGAGGWLGDSDNKPPGRQSGPGVILPGGSDLGGRGNGGTTTPSTPGTGGSTSGTGNTGGGSTVTTPGQGGSSTGGSTNQPGGGSGGRGGDSTSGTPGTGGGSGGSSTDGTPPATRPIGGRDNPSTGVTNGGGTGTGGTTSGGTGTGSTNDGTTAPGGSDGAVTGGTTGGGTTGGGTTGGGTIGGGTTGGGMTDGGITGGGTSGGSAAPDTTTSGGPAITSGLGGRGGTTTTGGVTPISTSSTTGSGGTAPWVVRPGAGSTTRSGGFTPPTRGSGIGGSGGIGNQGGSGGGISRTGSPTTRPTIGTITPRSGSSTYMPSLGGRSTPSVTPRTITRTSGLGGGGLGGRGVGGGGFGGRPSSSGVMPFYPTSSSGVSGGGAGLGGGGGGFARGGGGGFGGGGSGGGGGGGFGGGGGGLGGRGKLRLA